MLRVEKQTDKQYDNYQYDCRYSLLSLKRYHCFSSSQQFINLLHIYWALSLTDSILEPSDTTHNQMCMTPAPPGVCPLMLKTGNNSKPNKSLQLRQALQRKCQHNGCLNKIPQTG